MTKDRFVKLSENYGKYYGEVFEELGFSYGDMQRSIFNTIVEVYPNFKKANILDIGCGDGESLAPFVDAGCTNLTGIDLNDNMIKASKKRFGGKVRLLKMDATDLSAFKADEFEIIIAAVSIHNIPFEERKFFWKELLRLKPKFFVAAEKIADRDARKHKENYEKEINAIIKIYKQKYNLPGVCEEWIKHHEYDEKEHLTLDEIKNFLQVNYNISLIEEFGMCKTILAAKKTIPKNHQQPSKQ